MRDELRLLVEQDSLAWAVGFADHSEIDNINILNATYLAMHRAIAQLKIVPQCLLIDGNRFKPYGDTNHHCIVEGDGKYLSIAAASVLAKTHRDEYMLRLHDEFPHYGWNSNKAYGTIMHREAIGKHGISPYHRMSFSFLPITSVVENDETSINNCM